jgi:hypothetical protein
VAACGILNQWADCIRSKFTTDNVHLINPQSRDHAVSKSFVNVIQQMGMQYSALTTTITELRSEVKALQSSFTTLQSQVHT